MFIHELLSTVHIFLTFAPFNKYFRNKYIAVICNTNREFFNFISKTFNFFLPIRIYYLFICNDIINVIWLLKYRLYHFGRRNKKKVLCFSPQEYRVNSLLAQNR